MVLDLMPLYISFKLAVVTTLCLLVVGIPLAYFLAYKRFRGKTLVEAVVSLPIVLPPTVLGFFLLVAMGNHSPVGRLYNDIFGHPLAFSFEGLVVASILYSLPFAVQPIQNGFEQVDGTLIDAGRTLGCSPVGVFFRVILPASKRAIITGSVLSFAHTLGEFGVVLMVGGNIPGVTKVASISIYESVETLNYTEALVMSLILLAISFTVLASVYYINRRERILA
ncbi:MAG TPA: molybdate ABC transporter permease subunit [Deltaproteobacteria bacterium]|nr:molybdate ABC transporter permease subunit [Deltaproteobacteria bacterium]